MKKIILLFIILIKIIGCITCDVQTNTKPKPWPGEVFYYYSEEMYEHPNIIKNFEQAFTDIEDEIDIIFYESSELNKNTWLITYKKGVNFSTVGVVDEPIIATSSYTLYLIYNLIFRSLGVIHQDTGDYTNWISQEDWEKLKEIYGE